MPPNNGDPSSKNPTPFTITPIRSEEDLAAAKTLIIAYAASLKIDLSYQNFQSELSSLPGAYTPTVGGTLLLAKSTPASSNPHSVIGCVALRALSGEICEMKRLYVSAEGRGMGVGRALVEAVLDFAGQRGYGEVRLDTLGSMGAARGLYADLGFGEIGAYYDSPVEGTVFMSLRL